MQLGKQYQQQQQAQQLASLGSTYGALPSTAPDTTMPGIPNPTAASNSTDPVGRQLASIAGIESGGRYDIMGPDTGGGNRAIGKYQIMANNVPEWTRAALGRSMTPDEFRNDPQAQEATARHRWTYYPGKYGPSGAARAWLAGEGGMNNPAAHDLYGTTVADYERRFNQGLY